MTGVYSSEYGCWRVEVVNPSVSPTSQQVTATSLPLPTGAATAANQSTEITALGTINSSVGTVNTTLGTTNTTLTTISGRLAKAATGTITSSTSAATTAVLKAANTARLGLSIFNDSTAILYVAFAATASTTVYSIRVEANGYVEVPFGYTGVVSGIWATANGAARVTEFT